MRLPKSYRFDLVQSINTEKCEILNNFFTSIFTNEQSDPPKFEMKVDNNVSEILVTK